MRRSLVLLAFAALACNGSGDATDNSREWLNVLTHKKAAVAPNATPTQKQMYADTLGAFVAKHPTHGRAREVYEHIQLDFARELASLGRYQDAIRFYRAVLEQHPNSDVALKGLQDAVDRLAVSRPKLLALEKGMSQRQVAHLLGKPIPGWTVRNERRDAVVDAWYYRKTDGGIAGVYFRDGELFAAEENSHAKLVPLMSAEIR
jgi:tetratricopeptide (TPR) repeat protein